METNPFRHIKLPGPTARYNYTSVNSGRSKHRIPARNREQHGNRIYRQLQQAWQKSENEFLVAYPERTGIYLEFISSPGFELMIKSLEDLRQGIRLCNVRTEKNNKNTEITFATVFIPTKKRGFFFRKVKQYLTEETKNGNPKNANLINSIDELRIALLIESFWTDDKKLIPNEKPEWCEVWLRGDTNEVVKRFEKLLAKQHINSKPGYIKFPERIVKLVQTNREQLQNLSKLSDDIAEYRKAKDTAEFFLNLEPFEQEEWADDLLSRLLIDDESQITICILDTGVNNGHPLLSPVLADSDCLTVRPEWESHDHHGHGTLMAGIAAYNNIQKLLESSGQITLYHKLESVKILPSKEHGSNLPELWGYITSQGISIAEINSPKRKRIICSSVAALDTRDRGRPTSWSATIDNITSGAADNERRLVILAAGNITDFNQITNYPNSQLTDSIHDPGQSWNALTIGAYTQLTDLTDPNLNDYSPLAQRNQISPFSTTSLTWEDKWPIKPEVVFEGGNIAVDNSGKWTECNDFSLISTYYQPTFRLFEPFNMTSAATAQAAYFAAYIQAAYPKYWPETIRGLIVHSANWPEELFKQFVQNRNSKGEIGNLLRIAGYGVPNIEKALYCARNSLTLIAEAEIQPFIKEKGKPPKTKEMHLYRLPWPSQILEELGEVEIKMRVTLSYFIEPSPGEIGWENKYRYPSHGLRFKINSPTESENEFIRRINKAVRDDEHGRPDTESPFDHWIIGQNRNRGSIHSDIWQGTAVDLSSSNLIAVFPSIGWWKERPHLRKFNNKTRYSLIISIETQEQHIDLYTPVVNQIQQIIKT